MHFAESGLSGYINSFCYYIPLIWCLSLLLTSRVAGQSECSLEISPTAASPEVHPAPTHSSEPAGQNDWSIHWGSTSECVTCSHRCVTVSAVRWCAYLDQLRQKNLKLSIWYLLKVVNCGAPHSLIAKTEKDALSHQTQLLDWEVPLLLKN